MRLLLLGLNAMMHIRCVFLLFLLYREGNRKAGCLARGPQVSYLRAPRAPPLSSSLSWGAVLPACDLSPPVSLRAQFLKAKWEG